jgi:ATP-dependent DNA helicase RecG
MSADEKDDVMRRFTADPGDPDAVDVVVATTVIEVGIDVPQATVMVIMDAERFGISQLHQLRGRIARGDLPGLCLLFTQAPRDSLPRGRLDAVAATTDGFALAALDLDIRREGDVLGAAQSGGRSSLQMLSVTRDVDVIVAARAAATDLIAADPMLVDHLALAWVVADLRNEEQSAYLERG